MNSNNRVIVLSAGVKLVGTTFEGHSRSLVCIRCHIRLYCP